MTVLAAPLIIAAHLEQLPLLPGWGSVPVMEGAPLRRDDLTEWVTIGYVAGNPDPSVIFEPVPDSQNGLREAGSIACQLITAQGDVAAARSRAAALLGPWVGWLARDRTLGARLLAGSEVHTTVDLQLATTRAGATAAAFVTITYTALTYG